MWNFVFGKFSGISHNSYINRWIHSVPLLSITSSSYQACGSINIVRESELVYKLKRYFTDDIRSSRSQALGSDAEKKHDWLGLRIEQGIGHRKFENHEQKRTAEWLRVCGRAWISTEDANDLILNFYQRPHRMVNRFFLPKKCHNISIKYYSSGWTSWYIFFPLFNFCRRLFSHRI